MNKLTELLELAKQEGSNNIAELIVIDGRLHVILEEVPGGSPTRFTAISSKNIEILITSLQKCLDALEFYAKGGSSNTDIWQHPDLGYFTGKRADQTLKEIKEELANL